MSVLHDLDSSASPCAMQLSRSCWSQSRVRYCTPAPQVREHSFQSTHSSYATNRCKRMKIQIICPGRTGKWLDELYEISQGGYKARLRHKTWMRMWEAEKSRNLFYCKKCVEFSCDQCAKRQIENFFCPQCLNSYHSFVVKKKLSRYFPSAWSFFEVSQMRRLPCIFRWQRCELPHVSVPLLLLE